MSTSPRRCRTTRDEVFTWAPPDDRRSEFDGFVSRRVRLGVFHERAWFQADAAGEA